MSGGSYTERAAAQLTRLGYGPFHEVRAGLRPGHDALSPPTNAAQGSTEQSRAPCGRATRRTVGPAPGHDSTRHTRYQGTFTDYAVLEPLESA